MDYGGWKRKGNPIVNARVDRATTRPVLGLLAVVAIVFNDNAYGNVKRIQETRFNGHTIATELQNPDMMKLAEAFGVEARRATSPQELRATLSDVFRRNDPVLIEVPVGPMPQQRFTPRNRQGA
jgi:thiamine pyrophosphate-dependent acetolactate synthase large subunit-like protein